MGRPPIPDDEPPCDACEHERRCARLRLACEAYAEWERTGVARDDAAREPMSQIFRSLGRGAK